MKHITKHIMIFYVPLIAFILIESIHRASLLEFVRWVLTEQKEVIVNYFFYFACFNVFYFFKQKIYLWISFVLTLIFSSFAFISHVKSMFRGVPIHPSDFTLIQEAFTVSEYLFSALDWKLITIAFILLIIIIVLINKLKLNHHIPIYLSMVLLTISAVIFFSFYTEKPIPFEKWGNLSTYTYAQSKHYDRNGFTLGFILLANFEDTDSTSINYTKENVLKIKNNVSDRETTSDLSPNVLYIMSESFWDPTIIDSLKLERDPLPFYHEFVKETTHGDLVVSVFGGNTGNSEFEALTGMSIWFLGGSHVVPFSNGMIDKPIDSMASILTRQGYVATAMHPFNMGYYDRKKNYRLLGFQNYIPPEYMYNKERRGKHVSDDVLMEQVMNTLKNNEKPAFVHVVTMENHGPYHGKKYKEHTISVDGPLSEENKLFTQDFVQGLTGADSGLKYLIGELEKFEEPTVVVWFGDHLPYLGQYKTYHELGFIKDENLENYEDFMKIHTTPFFIWDNYKQEKNAEELRMSANFIAPFVLDYIQKEGNTLTDFLQGIMKQGITVTPSPQFTHKEGLTPDILKPYELLQYDALQGEQYTYEEGIKIEQEDYHFGPGPITLDDIQVSGSSLELKGEYFVPDSKIFINGKEVDTQYVDPQTLKATIPNGASGELEVEVVMIDEWTKEVLERTSSITVNR